MTGYKNSTYTRDVDGGRGKERISRWWQLPANIVLSVLVFRCLPLFGARRAQFFVGFAISSSSVAWQCEHTYSYDNINTYCTTSRKWKITFCWVFCCRCSWCSIFRRCLWMCWASCYHRVCHCIFELCRVLRELKMTCRIAASRTNNTRKANIRQTSTVLKIYCQRHTSRENEKKYWRLLASLGST